MASLQTEFRALSTNAAQDEILSLHPEILAIFFDVSQIYREKDESKQPLQPDQAQQRHSAIVVKAKDDIFTLVNEHREDLMNLIGAVREECTEAEFRVPSASSQLWPEFDAVRFAGYDKLSAKRSATILSLDYFSQSKTSLNILSYEDKRIHRLTRMGPTELITTFQIHQATLLPNQLYILHDQWVYQAGKPQDTWSVTFGPTANLLVSGACIVGRDQYGLEIKRKILEHYSQISRQRATAASLAKDDDDSPAYVEWLNQEIEDACPTCHITESLSKESEDFPPSADQYIFSFGETRTIRMSPNHDFSSSASTLPLEAYERFEDGFVAWPAWTRSPPSPLRLRQYQVTITGDADATSKIFLKEAYDEDSYSENELKRAKLASTFYPRVQVPRIASITGDLLYPQFEGITQTTLRSSARLVALYIRSCNRHRETSEKILYMEMVKAEDTLRAYRKSLSQNIVENVNSEYEIQQFFHQGVVDRTFEEFYGDHVEIADRSYSLEELMEMKWTINGQVYPPLSTLFKEASERLSSASLRASSCPMVFGLGDADGGQMKLAFETPESGRRKVLFNCHKYGGFHPVMLDLAIPLYRDLFQEPLYGDSSSILRYPPKVQGKNLFINLDVRKDSLTQAILDIKLRYLIQPLFEEARKLGYSLDDHVPILASALLLCATTTRSFATEETAEGALISNFAFGIILSTSRDWEGFLANLEKLGFATK
ncbi:hypothetical protein F4776DRAFT_596029 [Hypoxylon sp. NC0597]|nr:hypothetical protein F4776DRAFT_596029 [Hypoxylon sp. NC0597]